jgi:hypothetical protein
MSAAPATPPKAAKGARKVAKVAPSKAKTGKGANAKAGAPTAREGSKKATILGMLAKGATLAQLMVVAGCRRIRSAGS